MAIGNEMEIFWRVVSIYVYAVSVGALFIACLLEMQGAEEERNRSG